MLVAPTVSAALLPPLGNHPECGLLKAWNLSGFECYAGDPPSLILGLQRTWPLETKVLSGPPVLSDRSTLAAPPGDIANKVCLFLIMRVHLCIQGMSMSHRAPQGNFLRTLQSRPPAQERLSIGIGWSGWTIYSIRCCFT